MFRRLPERDVPHQLEQNNIYGSFGPVRKVEEEISDNIIWEWQSNADPWSSEQEQWTAYKPEDNSLLEKAYQNKEQEVILHEWIVRISDNSMIQKKKDDPSKERQVRRIDKNAKQETQISKVLHPRMQRFVGGERPKTYTSAFGSLGDYLVFFENRTPEMTSFAEVFEDAFKEAEASQKVDQLNQEVVLSVIDCIQKEADKDNNRKDEEKELLKLFKDRFASFEEFYKTILRAYTKDTFLYKNLNENLRNENWAQLDDLLPYAFCLCKAFHYSKLTSTCNQYQNQAGSTQNLLLYRGAQFDKASLNCYSPGAVSTFSWNAVTSTSTNCSVAEIFIGLNKDPNKTPVMFIIEVSISTADDLKNLKLIDVKDFSEYPGEDEIVLAPGSIFELISFTVEKKWTEVKLRLISDTNVLPLQGQIMPGAMHAQVSKGKVAKIISQQGRELVEALQHLKGNRMIEEIEFRLCKYDEDSLKVLAEVLPTLPMLSKLELFSLSSDENKHLETIMKIVGKLKILSFEIFDRLLSEKDHLSLFLQDLRQMKSLTNLKLDFTRFQEKITDEEVKSLSSEGLRHLTSLTSLTLNFTWCSNITDNGMKSLCSEGLRYLTSLTTLSLEFDHCQQLTDEGMKNLCLEGLKCSNSLTTLNLGFGVCTKITDEGVKILCSQGLKYLVQLRSLALIFEYCKKITDEGINILSIEGLRHLNELKTLSINSSLCKNITSKGLKSLGAEGLKYLTSLTNLDLNFFKCDSIKDKGVRSLCSEGLRYLNSLTTLALNFRFCRKITDEGVESLCSEGLQYLNSLEKLTLNFTRCSNITDEGVRNLCSGGLRKLASLKTLTLNFEWCYEITDEGLRTLCSEGLKHMNSLADLTLDFHRCQITDEGVKTLCSEGFRHLNSLKTLTLIFKDCEEITNEGIKNLCSEGLGYLTSLTTMSLDFEYCQKITEEGINSLRTQAYISKPSLIFHYKGKTFSLKRKIKPSTYKSLGPIEPPSLNSEEVFTLDTDSQMSYLFTNYVDTGKLQDLKAFTLNYNLLSIQGLKKFYSEGLRCMTSLRSLTIKSVNNPNFTDEEIKSLCSEGLRYQTSLTTLNLIFSNSNTLQDKELKTLGAEGLRHLTSLSTLTIEFSWCKNLTPEGMKNLCSEGLRYLTSLKTLDLNFANTGIWGITDDIVRALCSEGLTYLTSLTNLTLNFKTCKNITDEGVKNLYSEGLRPLTSLTNLSLDFGECDGISDEGLKSLCSEGLRYLTSLTTLVLDFQWCKQITDEGVKDLLMILQYFRFH